MIAAWLPVNFLSGREFHLLTRTFQEVFPHTTLWFVGPGHVILIGTPERYAPDLARMAAATARPAAREDLALSNLDDPYELASMLVLDEDAVRRFAGQGSLNTDDRPRIEYGISFSSDEWYRILQEIYGLTPKQGAPFVYSGTALGSAEEVRARFERTLLARSYSLFGSIVQTIGMSTRNVEMVEMGVAKFRRAVEILPESRNTKRLLEDKERILAGLRSGGATGAPGAPASQAPPAGGVPGR